MSTETEQPQEQKKKITFRKFSYRGVDLDDLLGLEPAQLYEKFHARARRKMDKGLDLKAYNLIKKLRHAKKDLVPGEQPKVIKTHLRNLIIVPEMIGSLVAVHNGQAFTLVEIKAEMIGHYLGEFSITYKPVKHGRPGVGATASSRFIPLK